MIYSGPTIVPLSEGTVTDDRETETVPWVTLNSGGESDGEL